MQIAVAHALADARAVVPTSAPAAPAVPLLAKAPALTSVPDVVALAQAPARELPDNALKNG
ncbi:hypothetical protein P0092_19010 [Ruminiclostridium papyrosolvens DSM 2782]|uniref:hypothetical protein n=1 Tax=Ruminiclostridium papyrosolvens TaxID=29362 RepID=UPI000301FB17|nr:hypothetical protein [Ruminiclostridium papyrosolvens]WES33835.1 hypothetical protein P0092_19010 [Ruminiclostridium papyrosolvens DSM 2782]